MTYPIRRNAKYKVGELEVILSLAPTKTNIRWLSLLLDRSEDAIAIVYRIAYSQGPFGLHATAQSQKIIAAKKRIGIAIGKTTGVPRKRA